jgi:hypothetical protein
MSICIEVCLCFAGQPGVVAARQYFLLPAALFAESEEECYPVYEGVIIINIS